MRAYLLAHISGHISNERGVTMVEYGILVGLIAVAAITAIVLLGDNILKAFTDVNAKFPPKT
ncbi:MAG: Flp family type IVb pilin [Acidobacteria bacterium]|nr:Flp family type IVb pilin [Acidobacteriota bacterium]